VRAKRRSSAFRAWASSSYCRCSASRASSKASPR
jgi:hypothetical protein